MSRIDMKAIKPCDKGKRFYWPKVLFPALILSLILPGTSLANDHYVFERPPKRVALVVGNSDYINTTPLPGAVKDAVAMSNVLETLGFDVTIAENVSTRADFLNEYFAPFLEKIEEGAFAVFYFSGHGFSFGGDSYLTTLNFPTTVVESKIFTAFLAEPALRAQMADRKPGFLLISLDACRNIGDLIVKDSSGSSRSVKKGLAALESPLDNVLITYASAPNEIAQGSTTDNLSIYTQGVTNYIDDEDTTFDQVLKEIGIFVRYETDNEQVPWVSGPSTAIVHFNPSERIRKAKREAWIAALGERTPRAVERFLRLHSVSDYASAARKWLVDYGTMQARAFSRVAALSVEMAWDAGHDRPLALSRVYGPLGMTRSQSVLGVDEEEKREALRGSVVTSTIKSLRTSDLTAKILAAHGETVVLDGRIKAYATPTLEATATHEFTYGTTLDVNGATTGGDGRTWLKVSSDENKHIFSYILLPETEQHRTIAIGKPSIEIFVDSSSSDIPWLIQKEQIHNAIVDLRKLGKVIGWVSIATPNVVDNKIQEMLGAQASHAALVTVEAGIPRGRISVVEGLEFPGDQVRVRLFVN
jgi:hypothetical protein